MHGNRIQQQTHGAIVKTNWRKNAKPNVHTWDKWWPIRVWNNNLLQCTACLSKTTSSHPDLPTWVPPLVTPCIATGTKSWRATVKSDAPSSNLLFLIRGTTCSTLIRCIICMFFVPSTSVAKLEVAAKLRIFAAKEKERNPVAATCTALSTKTSYICLIVQARMREWLEWLSILEVGHWTILLGTEDTYLELSPNQKHQLHHNLLPLQLELVQHRLAPLQLQL